MYVRLPWLLLIPLALLIPRLCAGRAAIIEKYYACGVYPLIKTALSALTTLVPFSIAEFLLYAIIAAVILFVLADLLRVLLGRASFAALVRRLVGFAIMGGTLMLLFYATWGLNYFRVPLKARMGLNVCERSIDELESLTQMLAKRADELRASLPEDENGVATLETGYSAVCDALPNAYAALAEAQPVFDGRVTRVKSVTWSKGLSWCGITGVYVGMTAEPNVNVHAPVFLLPHTAAHEMAHQLGIASEDEAEFAGYLACMESDDPAVRYAGVLSMLIRLGNALHGEDEARYEAIYGNYSEALLRDLRFQRAYWDAFEGKVEEHATQMNDAYLKHNAQDSGVKSYGEVVDMLLAYYEQTDF